MIKKCEQKLHKLMKQYNSVSHSIRRLEGSQIERRLEIVDGVNEMKQVRSRSRSGYGNKNSKTIEVSHKESVDRASIEKAKSNSCSLRRRSNSG